MWTRMEQKYLCWDQQVLKESHLTCYFGSSQKKRATQPTQQVLSKLRLFSCSWFWEKKNSLSLLCIDCAAPHVVLQWSQWPQSPFSLFPMVFLGLFLLSVVSDQPQGVTAPHTNRDLAIFRRYGVTHAMLSFGAEFSVFCLLPTNLHP